MSDSAERNAAAYRTIVERLQRGENGNWREVRMLHSAVAEATFWRLIRKARQAQAGEGSVAKARQQLADFVDGKQAATATNPDEISPRNPQAPPSVAAAFRSLDLLGHIKRQLADVELLRLYAISDDGRVKNPMFFCQSISLRDRTVGTALRLTEGFWGLEQMWSFYDRVVAAVAAKSPETAQAIIAELGHLRSCEAVA